MSETPLKLFYEEPDPDRWVPLDRHPRRVIRRIVRGAPSIGGVQRWFVNLCHGLDQLGVAYDVNDYAFFRRNRDEIAFVVGKSHVIGKIPQDVPVVYGPGVDSHPCANTFWSEARIVHLLISCEWFAKMYERDLPVRIPISVWPAGIETNEWLPGADRRQSRTIIVYDKIRWEREHYEPALLNPVINELSARGFVPVIVRYGFYREEEYRNALKNAHAMVFLCEHETQGFAYLQALSSGVPILAWDRGGLWKDPSYYPDRVKFGPVTSVPYFDERCGAKFKDLESFRGQLPEFLAQVGADAFTPREYVTETLDLKRQAARFIELTAGIAASLRKSA